MRRFWAVLTSAVVVAGMAMPCFAENSVVVSSTNAGPGQIDVVIPVFLVNDVDVRHVVCPLLIRKLSAAYLETVALDVSDRLEDRLTSISFFNHYNNGILYQADCKRFDAQQPPSPGGFDGVFSYNGNEKQTVTGIPYGIMFSQARYLPGEFSLEAGADMSGSYLITMDVGTEEGCFEIDTTCVNPWNHLLFSKDTLGATVGITPLFVPGVIHVGECQSMPLPSPDPSSLDPHNGQQSSTEILFSWESVPEARAYEIRIDTVNELFNNIWIQKTVVEPECAVTLPASGMSAYWTVRSIPFDCSYCLGEWVISPHFCSCPFQSDFDSDSFITALDLTALIDILFAGQPDIQDPPCPKSRADFDCDGFATTLDLSGLIDHLYAGGAGPCAPCEEM